MPEKTPNCDITRHLQTLNPNALLDLNAIAAASALRAMIVHARLRIIGLLAEFAALNDDLAMTTAVESVKEFDIGEMLSKGGIGAFAFCDSINPDQSRNELRRLDFLAEQLLKRFNCILPENSLHIADYFERLNVS